MGGEHPNFRDLVKRIEGDAAQIERLRSALKGLLAEVEYAISIINVPCTWTDEDQDAAITNARAVLEKLR